MAIGLGDALFGEFLHPNRENVLLDTVLAVVGLVIAASASRSAWNDRKPWIPPHDPMRNHDGSYQY